MSGPYGPFSDPCSVQWPDQFITPDGYLACQGVIEDGKGPYGLVGCDLCGWHDENRPLEPSHVMSAPHRSQLNKARANIKEFWQQLICPDRRPYYYCHITKWWTFKPPPNGRSIIWHDRRAPSQGKAQPQAQPNVCTPAGWEACTPATTARSSYDVGANHSEELCSNDADSMDIDERLRMAVELPGDCSQLYDGVELRIVDDRPERPDTEAVIWCVYCNRQFKDVWSRDKHYMSVAGRNGHPAYLAEALQKLAGRANLSEEQGEAEDGIFDDPDRGANALKDRAIKDVAKAVDDKGRPYWYNPWTLARFWLHEEVVKNNLRFYKGVFRMPSAPTVGPNGETQYWCYGDGEHRAWDMKTLYSLVYNLSLPEG